MKAGAGAATGAELRPEVGDGERRSCGERTAGLDAQAVTAKIGKHVPRRMIAKYVLTIQHLP